jgi:acid stress-induced BolA-like protein IbaG/YrbA
VEIFECKCYILHMAMDLNDLRNLIQTNMPEAQVHIDDLRGDGEHYCATVISPTFKGKTRVQQHQMVYNALEGKMTNELHALQIKTQIS